MSKSFQQAYAFDSKIVRSFQDTFATPEDMKVAASKLMSRNQGYIPFVLNLTEELQREMKQKNPWLKYLLTPNETVLNVFNKIRGNFKLHPSEGLYIIWGHGELYPMTQTVGSIPRDESGFLIAKLSKEETYG